MRVDETAKGRTAEMANQGIRSVVYEFQPDSEMAKRRSRRFTIRHFADSF